MILQRVFMSKKILYVDMDGVLVDFKSAFSKIPQETLEKYKDKDDIPSIFSLMDPMEGAIESYQILYIETAWVDGAREIIPPKSS